MTPNLFECVSCYAARALVCALPGHALPSPAMLESTDGVLVVRCAVVHACSHIAQFDNCESAFAIDV